jgi:hypothetical protein
MVADEQLKTDEAGDAAAQPLLRRDIQEGLRRVHELLTATQEESLNAAADVRALA